MCDLFKTICQKISVNFKTIDHNLDGCKLRLTGSLLLAYFFPLYVRQVVNVMLQTYPFFPTATPKFSGTKSKSSVIQEKKKKRSMFLAASFYPNTL